MLTACLLAEGEFDYAASREIRSFLTHAQESGDGPPIPRHYHALRPSAHPFRKAWPDICPFRYIGAVERGRIAPQGPQRPKIGVKNCPFLESYTTMRRPRRQMMTALGRTKAYLYHTNELGRVLQLVGATGLIQCQTDPIFSKIIL